MFAWMILSAMVAWGQLASYRIESTAVRSSTVVSFTMQKSAVDEGWMQLSAVKANGAKFTLWILGGERNPKRYLLQEGEQRAREYRNALTGGAVTPSSGIWRYLPQPVGGTGERMRFLGHAYVRDRLDESDRRMELPDPEVVELRPDLLIGQASNTKQKDQRRRWDGSEYELVKLTREDYAQMRDAGINCVRVDDGQWKWADELGLFYWGRADTIPYPEGLFRSQYLGASLYLDEPAVGTRDHAVRPRFEKEPEFRKSMTPQVIFEEFRKYYEHAWREGSPMALMKALRSRPDVDPGEMEFRQENLHSWETMVSTAAYQLTQDARVPEAMVFEPPGRIGTRRTLPEMNMSYGVEFPPDDAKALASIIMGFLRGAARVSGKQWGISIYGAFDRADAPWWLTHAYDLGATRFFFWDNYQLACVPFPEVLAHARHLREHARSHPRPAPERLREAGEVAILLPPGYDLGHVQTGKGNLWGIGELNLERRNRYGVSYRRVMGNFFSEIERAVKSGTPFDLLWDLPGLRLEGYREVVRIREDGKVEVGGTVLERARTAARTGGPGPGLRVQIAVENQGSGAEVTAKARVEERAAKVYYTYGADDEGVYRNAMVAWEVYGPEEEDQLVLLPEKLKPRVSEDARGGDVEVRFAVKKPGAYRLRASTVDTAGRTAVVWESFTVR